MENAKIFLVEDNEAVAGVMQLWLEESRHKIIHWARTPNEATNITSGLSQGDIDVVLLDNELTTEDGRIVEAGASISALLRNRLGDTVRIISTTSGNKPIEGSDVHIPKPAQMRDYLADIAAYNPAIESA